MPVETVVAARGSVVTDEAPVPLGEATLYWMTLAGFCVGVCDRLTACVQPDGSCVVAFKTLDGEVACGSLPASGVARLRDAFAEPGVWDWKVEFEPAPQSMALDGYSWALGVEERGRRRTAVTFNECPEVLLDVLEMVESVCGIPMATRFHELELRLSEGRVG